MLCRRSVILTAVCAVSIFCAAPTLAHEAPRVETKVTLTPAGEVDVTHVLQLSAAQRLLFKAGVIEKNDLTGLKARAEAALYSSKRFELRADGKIIPLDILGAEVEGEHIYIYQIGNLSTLPETWSARNSILRDLSVQFDNVINVPTTSGIRTIVFSGPELNGIELSD